MSKLKFILVNMHNHTANGEKSQASNPTLFNINAHSLSNKHCLQEKMVKFTIY